MNAVPALLKLAEDAGVQLYLDGDKVRLRSATPPPAALVAQLRQHKEAVLSFLRDGAGNLCDVAQIDETAPPWLTAYAERIAIMTEDGHVPEAEARAEAYQEAIITWLRHQPLPESKDGHCARCGDPITGPDMGGFFYRDSEHMDALPVHGKCVQLLQHERRAAALAALAAAGIREP